jgi:hypothetical protein
MYTNPSLPAYRYDTTGIQQRSEAFYRRKEALETRKRICEASDPPRRNDEILLYNSFMEYAISYLHYHRWKQAEPIIEVGPGRRHSVRILQVL